MKRAVRLGLAGAVLSAALSPCAALAQDGKEAPDSVEIYPTLTPTGDEPSAVALHAPSSADGVLAERALELSALLRDAAQDLGLALDLTEQRTLDAAEATDSKLIERAQHGRHWQIAPRLELSGERFVLRLTVVPAGSNVALVRVERVTAAELPVRAVVMLRDLVRAGQGSQGTGPSRLMTRSNDQREAEELSSPRRRTRSEGRAVLAANAGLFGGFVGYALQKSSGSDDARLTYPLLALGTGVGVGGSLLIAEEWDVGSGDAWFLSAGAVWPTVGGLLLARGRNVQPESDRYAYGIAGGLAGLTLASTALSFKGMGERAATMAHSGAILGMGLGAGTELVINGDKGKTPYLGMGYGMLAGVVVGGALATQTQGSASRVLLIDVGAGLGALAASAVASPLLIGDRTEARERAWVLSTMTGAVAGGIVAAWTTREGVSSASQSSALGGWGVPYAGVIGHSTASNGSVVPALGMGWSGLF